MRNRLRNFMACFPFMPHILVLYSRNLGLCLNYILNIIIKYDGGAFMREYFKVHPWNIIEEGFDPDYNEVSESVMSLGNGHMGCRGNFEEDYSGKRLQGTYIAGVYYPDKTRVGWWKNGYPEYFAKVLNATNFIGIQVKINDETLDLNIHDVTEFSRVLHMKEGYLQRNFIATVGNLRYAIESKRFFSMATKELAVISYSIKALDQDAMVEIIPYLDGDVRNQDANYDDMFWLPVNHKVGDISYLTTETKKTGFKITTAMTSELSCNWATKWDEKELYVANHFKGNLEVGNSVHLVKYVAVTTNRDMEDTQLLDAATSILKDASRKGYDVLFEEHVKAWQTLWDESDITIEGDDSAQQGIRFNIFHLKQTYTGEDSRLNIGPKGFTGEKYGGTTYWDTEAYCIPFFLSTAPEAISRQLLIYRYEQLGKAIENAGKLGLQGALYPMVTANGEECHNEWEITFEEIHRNGAIAYAIFNYVRYTGDTSYLASHGIYVLAAISRFWADRVHYNKRKSCYMMHGVTGPNEYENNVNNNWYTNTMATWTLGYTLEVLQDIKASKEEIYLDLVNELSFSSEELDHWQHIIDNMYYPYVDELQVFEQHDGFMDKELMPVTELKGGDLPLNQNWSWDRILRSCFIKQADVLQGLYFFGHLYDRDTKKRNFDFYEPMTVHESSLSPCIHAILAAELGYEDKAEEMYLRTARLDIDNYNNDSEDGLHITSMAGTWMSVVHGFGGLRVHDNHLHFHPFIPQAWESFSFTVTFRGRTLKITVKKDSTDIELVQGEALHVFMMDKKYLIEDRIVIAH